MTDKECDGCGTKTPRKLLGKIRGKYLCKSCRIEKRKDHREKTIEDEGIKDDLRILKNKMQQEAGYLRKAYAKKVGRPVKKYKDYGKEGAPIPKGSIVKKKKPKSNCYLTFHERQDLFRILLSRGMDTTEAEERIQDLMDSQEDLKERLEGKNKSEEEIKQKQKELIEELWK